MFCIVLPLWVLRRGEDKPVGALLSMVTASLVGMIGGAILAFGVCFASM